MTLDEAFKQLSDSDQYRTIAKQRDGMGAKYRTYRYRFNQDKLKAAAMVELLITHGYKITASRATRTPKTGT